MGRYCRAQPQPEQPQRRVPQNGECPQTFVDLRNQRHITGFSIYVPSGWYIDHFPTDRDGRTRSYLPGRLGTEFEQPVVLCKDRYAIPPSVDPNSLVTYNCLAEGTGTVAPLSVRMINILALGSPLEIHMGIYDEDPRFTFGTKRIASISNTTIPLVDSATNQTIQEIPAQIAQVEVTEPISATGLPKGFMDTVLYANLPDTESKDTYIVTWRRAKDVLVGDSSLEAEANAILRSFRIIVKDSAETPTTTTQPQEEQRSQGASTGLTEPSQDFQRDAFSFPIRIIPGSSSLTTNAFHPNPVAISIGDLAIWTSEDAQPHTVTSGENVTPDGRFDSGIMTPGETFEHTFTAEGEYPYFCILHPNMVGTVSVS